MTFEETYILARGGKLLSRLWKSEVCIEEGWMGDVTAQGGHREKLRSR